MRALKGWVIHLLVQSWLLKIACQTYERIKLAIWGGFGPSAIHWGALADAEFIQ